MRTKSVRLYARLDVEHGNKWVPVTFSKNGHEQQVEFATSYFIRFTSAEGKRTTMNAGKDLNQAVVLLRRQETTESAPGLLQDFQQHAPAAVAPPAAPALPAGTWSALRTKYTDFLRLQVKTGDLAESTQKRYLRSLTMFEAFLDKRGVSNLSDSSTELFNTFKESRIDGGAPRGFATELRNLHIVFEYAVTEAKMMTERPMKSRTLKTTVKDAADEGAQPFTAAEVQAMKNPDTLKGDALMFWLLLQTGLRRGDVMDLRWSSVNGFVTRKASKNGKTVRIPLLPELKAALDAERAKRYAGLDPATYATDYVVLNPETGKPFSGDSLYHRVKRLGHGAHPHRFRDTFAADAFLRGCSQEEVAAYLGDDVKTVAKHYASFVTERQDRADAKMLAGKGLLETTAVPA